MDQGGDNTTRFVFSEEYTSGYLWWPRSLGTVWKNSFLSMLIIYLDITRSEEQYIFLMLITIKTLD